MTKSGSGAPQEPDFVTDYPAGCRTQVTIALFSGRVRPDLVSPAYVRWVLGRRATEQGEWAGL